MPPFLYSQRQGNRGTYKDEAYIYTSLSNDYLSLDLSYTCDRVLASRGDDALTKET